MGPRDSLKMVPLPKAPPYWVAIERRVIAQQQGATGVEPLGAVEDHEGVHRAVGSDAEDGAVSQRIDCR